MINRWLKICVFFLISVVFTQLIVFSAEPTTTNPWLSEEAVQTEAEPAKMLTEAQEKAVNILSELGFVDKNEVQAGELI